MQCLYYVFTPDDMLQYSALSTSDQILTSDLLYRFDTLFYVYCTNKGIPPARVDNREAVTAQVISCILIIFI